MASLVSNLLVSPQLPCCPSLPSTTTTTTNNNNYHSNYHNQLLLLPFTLKLHSNPRLPKLTINNNNNNQETQPPHTITTCCFPSLAWAHIYCSKSGSCFNFQLLVGEDEPEEALIRRFRRETRKSGIIYESRTKRRFFQSSQDKKKRKAREAAHKRRLAKGNWNWNLKKGKESKPPRGKWKKEEDSDDDNWELPEGELPY